MKRSSLIISRRAIIASLVAILLGLTVLLVVFGLPGAKEASYDEKPIKGSSSYQAPTDKSPLPDHYAIFKTNMGEFSVRLYGTKAPLTVRNFDNLVKGGFYNNLTFHRVIDNFMIQGGDPNGNGTGGPGYKFLDEINKDLHFDKPGLLAMANSGPNTNGSQFFITVAPTPWLDGHYTIFGTVVKGYEVVEAISKVKTGAGDKPEKSVVIESITLEPMKNEEGAK